MAARRFNVQSYFTGGSRDTGSNLAEIVRSFLNADEALSIHQPFGKLIVEEVGCQYENTGFLVFLLWTEIHFGADPATEIPLPPHKQGRGLQIAYIK